MNWRAAILALCLSVIIGRPSADAYEPVFSSAKVYGEPSEKTVCVCVGNGFEEEGTHYAPKGTIILNFCKSLHISPKRYMASHKVIRNGKKLCDTKFISARLFYPLEDDDAILLSTWNW
jgi:hypothetical protein